MTLQAYDVGGYIGWLKHIFCLHCRKFLQIKFMLELPRHLTLKSMRLQCHVHTGMSHRDWKAILRKLRTNARIKTWINLLTYIEENLDSQQTSIAGVFLSSDSSSWLEKKRNVKSESWVCCSQYFYRELNALFPTPAPYAAIPITRKMDH